MFLFFINCPLLLLSQEEQSSAPLIDFETVSTYADARNGDNVVHDFDNIFSSAQKAELTQVLKDFSTASTKEISVLTVKNYAPYQDIQQYAADLGNFLGMGGKNDANAVIVVLCRSRGALGIVPGTTAETVFTPAILNTIVEQKMVPELSRGDFYKGMKNGVEAIIAQWQ